jgi:uncharacterized RDD family membrane protein YckC
MPPLRTAPEPAGLLRRLGAILYDTLLLLALEILGGFLMLTLSGGEAIVPGSAGGHALLWTNRAFMLGVAVLFFCGFWSRGGETLGMRAWRVRLQAVGGGRVGWGQALVRFAAALLSWACLGCGFWAALFDPRRRTWHDRLSGTELVRVRH